MWWHVMTYSYDIDIYIDHHRNHVRNRNIGSCQGNSVSEGCSITKSEWLVPTHLVAGSDFGHLGAWNTGRILEFHGIFNRKIWKGYQHNINTISTQWTSRNPSRCINQAPIKQQWSINMLLHAPPIRHNFDLGKLLVASFSGFEMSRALKDLKGPSYSH